MTRHAKRTKPTGAPCRAIAGRRSHAARALGAEHRPSAEPRETLADVVARARACTRCAAHLPLGPNPVLRVHADARLLIVGQAPGTKVHATGIPWNDPSGDRLREWLALDRESFYDDRRIAILPTGLCYPGRGSSGDLPPRAECAPEWHPPILARLPRIELVLLVGSYAQAHYLDDRRRTTLTDTVRAWSEYAPRYLPLPHPSPRNTLWLRRNPWFESEVVPVLRTRVQALVGDRTAAAAGSSAGEDAAARPARRGCAQRPAER